MSPYERAWRRAERTGVPALYFLGGVRCVASVPGVVYDTNHRLAWKWAKA